MIHEEFGGAKEDYMGSGWKYEIAGQTQMLKRKYPDYKKGDYVLWIVPDIWMPFKYVNDMEIKASIELIQGEKHAPLDVKVRRPYPNNMIYQMAMKNGKGSLFGIPFVFHSFNELAEVTGIHLKWQLMINQNVSVTDVTYELQYEKEEGKYNYTIAMKDNSPFLYSSPKKEYKKIMNEWRGEFQHETIITYIQSDRRTEIRKSRNSERYSVETLNGIAGLSRINEYLSEGYRAEEQKTYFILSLHTQELLRPSEIVKITAEPSFGFDNITPEELDRYESYF